MAKRIRLVDDLDETLDADDTVIFGIDGYVYSIDLCGANAAALRAEVAPYREAATKLGKMPKFEVPDAVTPPRKSPIKRQAKQDNGNGDTPAVPSLWDDDHEYDVHPDIEISWLRRTDGDPRKLQARQRMRQWMITHGWPDIKPRGGLIAQDAIDAYWSEVVLPSKSRG